MLDQEFKYPAQNSEQDLRLRAIELIAYWEGRLITSHLTELFGISRQQASKDIQTYNKNLNINALVHDRAIKGYIPVLDFAPKLTKGHINEYIALLTALSSDPMSQVFEQYPSLVSVQLPDRAVRPEVVREIIKACRNRTSLKILYASMSTPKPHERIISPHTLIYTGFRWHVRAWCHTRQTFRDFLLSRIIRTPYPSSETGESIEADHLWNETQSFMLIPNQRLIPEQKAVIERDFGMPEGRLLLNVRKALIHYTLHRYQAAISMEQENRCNEYPLQIHPDDRPKIQSYLFSGEG